MLTELDISEASAQLDAKLADTRCAVEACVRAGLWEPVLVLLYASIDSMAWLDRPASQEDVHEQDFVVWTNRYLVPALGAGISADDLYGARCGILHSNTGESKRHREFRAKKLLYHRVVNGLAIGIVQVRMSERVMPPSLDLDRFVNALGVAVSRFREDLEQDVARQDLVLGRVLQSYYSEVTFSEGAA